MMGNLGLVLADIVLIIVALAGGVLTLVRARRVGGLAVGLATAACAILVLASIIDMVWWVAVFPSVIEDEGYSGITTAHAVISGLAWFLTVIAIGLLFASTNVGRTPAVTPAGSPAADPAANPAGGPFPGPTSGFTMPPATQPPGPGGATPAPTAQPAQGWTPPQQAQPDWNIHSGVWSIPRGTFDGPPPDQRQH
jgi:hypothetical protein